MQLLPESLDLTKPTPTLLSPNPPAGRLPALESLSSGPPSDPPSDPPSELPSELGKFPPGLGLGQPGHEPKPKPAWTKSPEAAHWPRGSRFKPRDPAFAPPPPPLSPPPPPPPPWPLAALSPPRGCGWFGLDVPSEALGEGQLGCNGLHSGQVWS